MTGVQTCALPIFKNWTKYVIMFHFYVSLLKKHTENINVQDNKKESSGTFASWDFKPHVGNLNFDQTSSR